MLPFVFLGRHDDDAKVRKEFRETWDETTGGQRAVTLYLKEILDLCQQHISSRQWTLKHAAALTVSDAINSLVKTQENISDTDGKPIWPILKTALSEKTWNGKSNVLEAFVAFVEKARELWTSHDEIEKDIVQVSHVSSYSHRESRMNPGVESQIGGPSCIWGQGCFYPGHFSRSTLSGMTFITRHDLSMGLWIARIRI